MAGAAWAKKAAEIVILDLSAISQVADFFVICHGTSRRRNQAIADAIRESLVRVGFHGGHDEGYEEGSWILLDCGDVVAHVFSKAARELYALERFWGDARREELTEQGDEAT